MTAKYYYLIDLVDDGAFISFVPAKYWNKNKCMSDFELNLDEIYDDWPFGCEETESTYSTPFNYCSVEESVTAAKKWLENNSDFLSLDKVKKVNVKTDDHLVDLRFYIKPNDCFVNHFAFEELFSKLHSNKELTKKIIDFVCGYLDKAKFAELCLSKNESIKMIVDSILDSADENQVKINWNKDQEPSLIEEFVNSEGSSKFIFEVFNFVRSYNPAIISTFLSNYSGPILDLVKKFGCGTSIIFADKQPSEIDNTGKYQYQKVSDQLWEVGNLFNGTGFLVIVDSDYLETVPDYFRFDKLISGDTIDISYSTGINKDVYLETNFLNVQKKEESIDMCCGGCNKEIKINEIVQAIPVGEPSTKASVDFVLDAVSNVDVYELIERIKACEQAGRNESALLRSILNYLTMF